ncbi:MAG: class II aldolase/adducin family protein [Spirochaetales bacterium]|nr:class II aldolase/adducin family protein [Spirochaetales bacterium]
MIYQKEREAVAATMRRLYSQGLTTCSGGNISLRVGKNHVLITPSALDKGKTNFRQIALMTLDGENYSTGLKPSIETDMHLKILKCRPDINAVVHAHPKSASYLTAVQNGVIRTDLLAEARYLLGEPAFAPYALMGTESLGDTAAASLADGQFALLMENHGVLTVGKTLLQAFDRIEVLEAAAEMTVNALTSGNISPLCETKLKEIDGLHS